MLATIPFLALGTGVGIVGQNLTIINSGTISGSSAIIFTGGTNSLELWAGSSITGNVGGGGTNTLVLGNSLTSFDLSQLGSQYQNFSQFQKIGTSTVTLSNTTAASTGWTVSAGTVNLTGATATATTVNN